jgi:hypothetical protein
MNNMEGGGSMEKQRFENRNGRNNEFKEKRNRPAAAAVSEGKGGAEKTRPDYLAALGKKTAVIDSDFNNSASFYYLPEKQR